MYTSLGYAASVVQNKNLPFEDKWLRCVMVDDGDDDDGEDERDGDNEMVMVHKDMSCV